MRMPFAPLWRALTDRKDPSIDLAATVGFGSDIPRIAGPTVPADRSIGRRDHSDTQAVLIFHEPGVALIGVTTDSCICRRDDHRAGIAIAPKAGIARPVIASNHCVGGRRDSNALDALLPVSGIAGPALAAERCISWDHRSPTAVFDPVPSGMAVPAVVPHKPVCRHDKCDAAVALTGKSGAAAPAIPGEYRIRWRGYARAGLVLLHGKAKGAFDLVSLNISACRRHQSFASLALLAETGYTSPLIANDDGVVAPLSIHSCRCLLLGDTRRQILCTP